MHIFTICTEARGCAFSLAQIRSVLVSALEASVSGGGADDERDGAAPESRPQPPAQRILHSVFAECLRVRCNAAGLLYYYQPSNSPAILVLPCC